MKYRTILLLNFAALLEAFVIKFLIDQNIVVCNLPGLHGIRDVIGLVAVKNILTLGGYQMYFWSQNNHGTKKITTLRPTALDRWIPAIPQAYWIYSPLYYIVFNLAFLCLTNYGLALFNVWLMLLHGSFWFYNFPTSVVKEFREKIRSRPMDRLTYFVMDLVHSQDTEENACPSMHCAIAMFITFIIYPYYPSFAVLFPILISLSCLVCKQHLVVDIIPGLALGALHGSINAWMHR